MAARRRTGKADWRVVVEPEGTPAEAAQVAERVLAVVAGWVRREAGPADQACQTAGEGGEDDPSVHAS